MSRHDWIVKGCVCSEPRVTTQGGAIFATIVGFNQGLVPELERAAGSMAETASPCNSYWPGRASTSSAKFPSKTLVVMMLQQLTMDRKVPNRSWKILILLNCSSIIGGKVPWSVNYLSYMQWWDAEEMCSSLANHHDVGLIILIDDHAC